MNKEIADKKGLPLEEMTRAAVDEYLKYGKCAYEIGLLANDWYGDGDFIATSDLTRETFHRLLQAADDQGVSVGRFIGETLRKAVSDDPGEKILELVFADQEDAS